MLEKIGEEFDKEFLQEEIIRKKLEILHNNFADEIIKFSAQLIGKRNREWFQNQLEYDRQLKRIKEEKEKLNEKIELELVNELKNHFQTQKKEFTKQKNLLIKSSSIKE